LTGARAAAAGGADAADAGARTLAAWVFAALVLASFAAFALTQHLKHTPTAVQRFEMTPYLFPYAKGARAVEHLSFRIAHADRVTVAVIDANGNVVATLLHERPLAGYRQLSLVWDGHRGPTTPPSPAAGTSRDPLVPVDHGPLAPAGEYSLRVSLRSRPRPVRSPRNFTLSLRVPGAAG
jgi:hypothetical protein